MTFKDDDARKAWVRSTMADIKEKRETTGKDKVRCCKQRQCWHALQLMEIERAVEDAAFFKAAGHHLYHGYIRALFLMSLKPLGVNDERMSAPREVGMYQHPAIPYGMCVKMFIAILGITHRTYTNVKPGATEDNRYALADFHGNRGNHSAAKPAAKAYFVEQTERLAREYGHVQPWPLFGLSEDCEVYVLSLTFSRNVLYNIIMKKAPENLTLSARAFENLFNSSDSLEHVVICKTAKRMCSRCMDWQASISALRAYENRGGDIARNAKVKIAVLQRLLENHTMRQRMSRDMLRQVVRALAGEHQQRHRLAAITSDDTAAVAVDVDAGCGHHDDDGDTDADVMSEAQAHKYWEQAVQLNVELPFCTSTQPAEGDIECFMFDYGKATRTPHKALETFNEHFALDLGYNVYLFVQHDPRVNVSTFYVYGEEHESKGTNNLISMIHHYLENCPHKRRAKHLVVCTENCSGENKNHHVCCYFRWRVTQGHHNHISWFFLELGHSRFALDTALGLFRQWEAKNNHETLDDVVQIIKDSTPITGRKEALAMPADMFLDWSALT